MRNIFRLPGSVLAILCACVLTLTLIGCEQSGSNGNNAAANPDAETIAVILMQEDQFFRLNEAGMREAANELGVNMVVSNARGKIDEEVKLIDTYIAQGVDAIVISPLSIKGSTPALERAKQSGINIILYNSRSDAEFVDFSVTSDQVALGRTTGEAAKKYINENLDGSAKVAIIHFTSQSLEQGPLRPNGFREAIADMDGVEVVAEQEAWIAHKATDTVETVLGANPDLDIVWAANEGGTVGAVMAVRNANRTGDVVVFGTDISEQLADFLLEDDGVLQAVTAQKPFEMGQTAMRNAVQVVRGEDPGEDQLLAGELFSRDNPEKAQDIKQRLSDLAE